MKLRAALLAFVILASAGPAQANFVEDLLDVSWTIGKTKEERDRIVLERRARRYAKKVGHDVNDGVKAAGNAARTFGRNARTAINKKYPARD